MSTSFSAGIITSSDKCHEGKRIDESGKIAQGILCSRGYKISKYIILPDDFELLSKEMIYMADILNVNLIITTGGTGFNDRDITPEATSHIINKPVPGISEAIRHYSLQITPRAMLSRGISGIRNKTLIVNLPGSPKAVKESLEFILDSVHHGLEILMDMAGECAR